MIFLVQRGNDVLYRIRIKVLVAINAEVRWGEALLGSLISKKSGCFTD